MQSAATTETGRLGRYELVQKLASGGMASVHLARVAGPAGFEKLVAVKRIHPHLADDKNFVDMFLDEARIASRIDHPNVCSVFDFGQADGAYYIAMEFLAGEPFSQVVQQMARSPKQLEDPRRAYFVARMIADASEGLHAAHELRGREGDLLNVVHRDISPQNLFLTYDGVVKVVDFGIASAADRLHHTEGAEMKGKFSYMAPEQARGAKGGTLDRRADVFALGIVLWEMLALKRLFRRDTPAETLMALMHDAIPTPSSQRPGLVADFDAIVLRALARNPAQRYQSAREFGRDLGKAIGKAGEVMGAPDLAEWLETLVPNAREASRQRIESARRGEVVRSSLVPPAEVSGSDIVVAGPLDVRARAADAPALEDDDADTQAAPLLTPAPPTRRVRPPAPPPPRALPERSRPSGRRGPWIFAAAVTVVLAIGTLAVVGLIAGRPPPSPEESVVVVVDRSHGAPELDRAASPASEVPTAPPPTAVPDAPEVGAPVARPVPASARSAPIEAPFRSRAAEVGRCFGEQVSAEGTPELVLRVEIGRDGIVSDASIGPAEIERTPLGRCLLEIARTTRFAPQSTPMSFSVPLGARRVRQ